MSHWAHLLSAAAKVNLLVLVVSAVFSWSSLSDRVPEFALTKIEESDIKDDSGKEPITEDDADPEDLEVFYPTHQWQTIRPGQAVPAGSHVRLNLQMGDREAKLPDSENGKRDTREERRRKRVDVDSNSFTSQELKKALAKLKESEKAERKAHEEEVRKKFRPIEQLKEEFEKLNVKMETDYEIMVKLISKFNSSASTLNEKVAALYDLEYYVHQVDNAKDFLSMGGLRLVIDGLNSTEATLKEHAAFVLGAALSGNPKVQIEAIEGGALQKLLVILAMEQPLAVKKKALFALSSMLRHFPYAQQQFLKLGGLQVLRSLFRQKGMETLHVRVVTLLYDLIVEKMLLEDSQHGEQTEEKIQQYRQVKLVPAVVEQDWCVVVSNLLAMPEHDTREKVLKMVSVLMAFCKDRYRGDQALSTTLSLLRSEYEELAAEEQREGDKDGYFKELLGSVNTIIQELR
ncbi:nucleotide exchange factor SIL1 [Falco rusticolus]|uniref:nucleotide exchange factor SIL1 n=1 Tax=Falco rusticolus TaxID=120794 RepID=UPI0018867589|nr:nucleotide exchange factor SIL1 [Falco rusticolus]XP_037253497.1 nucleotide exchange factor SIL1 [Falco rusticolus]XP_037253498.1 nucleotide exchange factor SIL1 [Falco rusticolus]XP_037253499.1 nucleotide exchange factor SIL1 [Falco rusticolus]XP_037253500.1 nucleotide exchange factor SIL1 [Falco rusticolus]XP_037253501.1 nucleotide exchange factor SIL1 [Falco rusticolus]XP_037253502.1 nucleotide exchange factor SIL1 [Falco rusticolus]XP_037253503.1 nucleotide exchange factor SIL1 [Falco